MGPRKRRCGENGCTPLYDALLGYPLGLAYIGRENRGLWLAGRNARAFAGLALIVAVDAVDANPWSSILAVISGIAWA
jgi:hypothetical protein